MTDKARRDYIANRDPFVDFDLDLDEGVGYFVRLAGKEKKEGETPPQMSGPRLPDLGETVVLLRGLGPVFHDPVHGETGLPLS